MPTTPPQLPIWSAPLMPVALAMTIGIVADRFLIIPFAVSFIVIVVCIIAWFLSASGSKKTLALVYLMGSVAGIGAAIHHWHRYYLDASDLSHFAERDAQPVRLRATLQTAPTFRDVKVDALSSFATNATTRFVVGAMQRQELTSREWHAVSGLVQVTVIGPVRGITVGDDVELLGKLKLPGEPMNPGEFDETAFLRDQGITTRLTVLEPSEVVLTRRGWPTSLVGLLAVVRGWGQETLARDFATQQDVAAALLLGEGSVMTGETWEQYQRTGVLHVLAISGQHFVVLAGFFWLLTRVIGMRRTHGALLIALLLFAYALLTGGRPPVMRAAWVIAAYCGGILLLRPVSIANTFALAWIGVILIDPTAVFNVGCQLSFLAVAVLVGPVARFIDEPPEPLEQVIDQSRPWYVLIWIWLWRWLRAGYGINAVVWVAVTPLLASQYHTISPTALLIGPPVTLLTSLALLTGFAFLFFAGWCAPIAALFAWVTQASLLGCEAMVSLGQRLPGAYFYIADLPTWYLWTFYVGLLISIVSQMPWRHGRWALLAGVLWLIFGATLQLWPHRPGELRCTFLAVGHGGCTVIETRNGRVIVYDAGAMGGPDVTRQQIAPYLWSRGIRHIDDLILSHGDLDHFNGVPQLADRFAIGRVLTTPTFAALGSPAVRKTRATLDRYAIPLDVVKRADRWDADGVSFESLHPPAIGPTKNENARSLVLLVKHADWSMLLTGDLEEEGLTRVLARPMTKVDVLMAPHHGSDRSNNIELARWAKPKLVVSCQTMPLSERVSVAMYEKMGAKYLGTWPHGAITIRPGAGTVETYRTKLMLKPF